MRTLRHAYVNTQNRRVINAADFKSVGVEDQNKVEWGPDNRHVATVSDDAAQWLLDNEPGDWEEVDSSTGGGDSSSEQGSGGDSGETSDASTQGITSTTRRKSS